MVLETKKATVAYRCPHCGCGVISVVDIFSLSADMIKLKCSCGQSELEVIKAENFVLDDATYEQMLKDFVQSSGKTEKEILERYEKKELSEMFAYSKIYEQVVSWQTFTEVAESES